MNPSSHLGVARVIGSGAIRVIVCHGWMGDHHLFGAFIEEIDRERFSFAFMDCRGYGYRLAESGPFTIEAMAGDIWEIAQLLHWEKFHVLGHSMGAMAAQWLMHARPEELLSAILVAPVPASGAVLDGMRRKLLHEAISDPTTRRNLIDINTGNRRSNNWLDELLCLSLRSTNPGPMAAYLQAWSETDFSEKLKGSEVPVLLILGDLDPGATLTRMSDTILEWCPHAKTEELHEVGHYPMLEVPGEFYRVIARYLTRC